MKKVLPLSIPEVINSYPIHTHAIAVADAKTKNYLPWVYNHSAQLRLDMFSDTEFKIFLDIPDPYWDMPNLHKELVSRRIFYRDWNDIIEFVKYHINRCYYVYILCDAGKLSIWRKNEFFLHDPLIYGYDDEREEIYLTDNFRHGKYSFGTASYEELICATESMRLHGNSVDWMQGYRCFQYQESREKYCFDKRMYVSLLKDYIDPPDERWVRGLDIYPAMLQFQEKILKTGWYLDRRAFYVQKEHKLIMEQTMSYVLGPEWKSKYPLEGKLLDENVKIATIMLNLCLKYNLTKEKNILDRITGYINKLQENEKILFMNLITIIPADTYLS